MPRVLLLHPGPVGFRHEQLALQKAHFADDDVRLILADDYLVDADRAAFEDVIELPPAERVGESLRVLERYCASHEVDAVVSQSESSVLLGALLQKSLSLPGISPGAAHLCVNKYRSRSELDTAGVPVPRFILAQDAARVRAFAREAGFPIVLKGVASALSRLVTLVKSESEIDSAVELVKQGIQTSLDVERLCDFAALARIDLGCDPRREFLVEAFAHGDPVETDGLVVGSEPRSFGVTEQVLSEAPRFFIEGYLLPADRGPREIAAIERVSDAALGALGVENTGYSIEMRLDRGAVSVIEVNGRLGWDEGFGDMFALATGTQPSLATLELALGYVPRIERRPDMHCALAYTSCYDDAIVKRVPTQAELELLDRDGVAVGLATYEGARMHAPPHPEVVPHLGFALASDPTSSRAAHARARAVVSRLRFELAPVGTDRAPTFRS